MSKIWKPGKPTVELPSEPRPSRIRRDPVRLGPKVEPKPVSPEREILTAVAGVVVVAAACAALIVGVSQVTYSKAPAVAAAVPTFGYCRTGGGPDCVIDGDTFLMAGERVEVAGIDAPEIHPSRCAEEASRGIEAAIRLRRLLNSGTVTLAGTEREADGRMLRKVEVAGRDVGAAMIAGGVAREYGGGPRSWCS